MNTINKNLFTYIFIFVSFLFSEEPPKYTIDFIIDTLEPLEYVDIATLKFIYPYNYKESTLDVSIKDAKGLLCKIEKINKIGNREIEIFFVPTSSRAYTAYINEKESRTVQLDESFNKGVMLIDDFIPIKSNKAGHWQWDNSNKISGSLSFTGKKEGTSFNRITFPSSNKIEKNDKIVCYTCFLEEKHPKEILVELITTPRGKSYFFSWGEDLINIGQQKKYNMGNLPEKNRWTKLEIPLTDINEKTLLGIAFYNFEGKIWWDRISINDVPMETRVVKLKEADKKIKAYFDYNLSSPFRYSNNTFEIIKIDATASYGVESFNISLDGQNYKKNSVEVPIRQNSNRKVTLTVEKEGLTDTMEYIIPKKRAVPKNINIVTKVLPYHPFIKEGQPFTIVLSVRNLNDETLPVRVSKEGFEKTVYLMPEELKHIYIDFLGHTQGETIKVETDVCGFRLSEKLFHIGSVISNNLTLDGPFIKDKDNNFIIIPSSDKKEKTGLIKKNFYNITLAGAYPQGTPEMLKSSLKAQGIGADIYQIGKPQYGRNHRLFSEYLHITKQLHLYNKGDILLFFPYIESMKSKTPILEWKTYIETIIYVAQKQFPIVVVATPFPSPPFPELYQPYINTIKEISIKKDIPILDVYKTFSDSNHRKLFMPTEGIYSNLPNKEGNHLFISEFINILLNLGMF